MRKYVLILAALCIRLACAQEHQLTVGAGGGLMLLNPQTEQEGVKQTPLPMGTLDLGYSFYVRTGQVWSVGFRTGAEIGGGMSAVSGRLTEEFTNTDYLGNRMQYTVTTGFVDRQQVLFAQVPLMLTLRAGGLTMGFGAKACLPLAGSATQTLRNPGISAYYELTGVTVTDRLITGVVGDDQMRKSYAGCFYNFSVKASAEVGYEWRLAAQSAFGLKAFADVSVYGNYANDPQGGRLIEVAPITDAANPVPAVTVNHATELYCRSMLPVEFGVKVYYAFVWDNYNTNQVLLNRRGRNIRMRLR